MKASKSSRLYFQSAGVNAPHKRDRVWFVAKNANSDGCTRDKWEEEPNKRRQRNTSSRNSDRLYREEGFVAHANDKGGRGELGDIPKANGEVSQRNEDTEPSNAGKSDVTNTTDDGRGGGKASGVKNDGNGWYRENKKGERWGVKLRDVAENGMLPTPKVQDERHALRDRGKSNLGEEMAEVGYQRLGTPSHLNPLFCAEMMGFPANWTVSPFLNGEKNQSKDTATQ